MKDEIFDQICVIQTEMVPWELYPVWESHCDMDGYEWMVAVKFAMQDAEIDPIIVSVDCDGGIEINVEGYNYMSFAPGQLSKIDRMAKAATLMISSSKPRPEQNGSKT